MPDSFRMQQGGSQNQNQTSAPAQNDFNVADIPQVRRPAPSSLPSFASSQPNTGIQSQAPTQTNPQTQSVPPASSDTALPKEQSVQEIEEELMIGAGPGQKNQSVVAGRDQKKESFSGTSIQKSHLSSEKDEEKIEEQLPPPLKTKQPEEPKEEPGENALAQKPKPFSDEATVKDKADTANLPYVNLVGFSIQSETLELIPKFMAEKYKIIAYLKIHHQVRVAAENPQDRETITKTTEILEKEGFEPLFSFCSEASIRYALGNYRERPKIDAGSGEVQVDEEGDVKKEIKGFLALKNEINKVSTSKLFDVLVSGALKINSSDIHIEPKKENMKIRYRVDGILQDIVELPFESYKSLLPRIKFLAKMKLDLKTLPQDGRFTIKSGEDTIDLRVSTLPTVYGESIVMRLLKQDKGFLRIEELGFNQQAQELVEEAISKPTGMILNTGPTGSGKTTTLYAVLDKLNKPGVKIITLEDPVEYRIDGVTQSQIDSYAKYGFARGLRSILRQDPDIVMVGEIRDLETARIALNASLTGHLVLSTLHTNNATAAASRLLELGVKPFLIAGNINLIIAQRLVRKLCEKCKKKYRPRPGIVEAIKRVLPKTKPPEFLWREIGCEECHGTGFSGRIPIVEAFKPSTAIEKMIIESTPAAKIRRAAIEEGMITMEQDGIGKALDGITTVQEVWRVTKE